MTAREQAMKLIANNHRFTLIEEPGQAIVIVGAKSSPAKRND